MKIGKLQLALLAASVALSASASESGGNLNGFGGVIVAPERPAPANPDMILAWGELTMRRTIETQTTFARRTATAFERRNAEQKGKAIYNDLPPEKKAELKEKKIRYFAVAIVPKSGSTSQPPEEKNPSDNTPAPAPEKGSSVANVDVMIYDTLGGETVNKYVYTVNSAPTVGTSMKLDDYETLYVGR